MSVLLYLVKHRHRVVSKEELLEQVWAGKPASSAALVRAVMKIRHQVGASAIQVVNRVGYRFVGALDEPGPARADMGQAADTIALLPIANDTGDPRLEWMEFGLVGLAAHLLRAETSLSPVSVPSLQMAVHGAQGSSEQEVESAVRRATGAAIVVRSRVTHDCAGAFRLDYVARGAPRPVRGTVAAPEPAELPRRLVEALVAGLELPPRAAQASLPAADPLADESFARGLHALALHRWAQAANLLRLTLEIDPARHEATLELLRAMSNTGTEETIPLCETLLDRARRNGDTLLEAQVHQALGRLYLQRSQIGLADQHLTAALRIAAGHGGPDWTARTLMLQASVATHRMDDASTSRAVEAMYVECERSGDRILPIAGKVFEAISAAAIGEGERSVALALDAARRARQLHADSYLVDACDHAAWELAKLGRLTDAALHAEEAVAVARANADPHHAAESAPALCWIYRLARMPDDVARVVASLPDDGDVARPASLWLAKGLLAQTNARHEAAAEAFGRAIAAHRSADDTYREGQSLPWFIDALVLCGRHAEAEREIDAMHAARFKATIDLEPQALHAQALLLHATGRVQESLAMLRRLAASAVAPLWRTWATIDAAWLLAEAGDAQAARELLPGIAPALRDHSLVCDVKTRIEARGHPKPVLAFLRTRL